MKRRASPLKESPARVEDETSDCPMEQVADENPSASQQAENVNMEQVDYDPDSDNDDDSDEEEQPPAGRPTSKAMPHPKLVPKSPPRRTSWKRRRNPTIILVTDLHFQGDQRCGQLSHPTIGGMYQMDQIPTSASRGNPYTQDHSGILNSSISCTNATRSAQPSSRCIRISTSFLSMDDHMESRYSG